MLTELQNYDIFPKVMPAGKKTRVTIRPLGLQSAFPEEALRLKVCPLHERSYPLNDHTGTGNSYTVTPDDDGCIRFVHAFQGEQEQYIRIYHEEKRICQLAVYSIYEDLVGLIPLMGDLHLHTIRSDGKQDPAFVAAQMRRQGYDFIAITDHRNFSGSLEAIDAYKDVPIGLTLLHGEEVHMPDCPIHIVHIGGRYSVNAMVNENYECIDRRNPGTTTRFPFAWTKCAGSDFPGTMSSEQFRQQVEAYGETLGPLPDSLPFFTVAGFAWVCDQIRLAGGLSIFAHPYWKEDMYHTDERLTQFLFEKQWFDAFEVLGGERYYEQNGFQTAHYYQAKANGLDFPVVGSSDSHSCINNANAFIGRTLCFARSNTAEDILSAIRASHAVAVDGISKELRLVGDYRLVKYGWFLLEHYFPLHDDLCYEQGRSMKEYYCGDRKDGKKMLLATEGRVEKTWKKYFD